jgi:hypothetical protein
LAHLNEIQRHAAGCRSVVLLYQGDTAAVIGDEASPATGLASRAWDAIASGMQLQPPVDACSYQAFARPTNQHNFTVPRAGAAQLQQAAGRLTRASRHGATPACDREQSVVDENSASWNHVVLS